jgi:enoyl-CoA hydratase/carnithine racemase
VRIDSPGGFVFDGLTIHNALVKHDAEVITEVEGIAASAASIIAVAGDKVRMAANGEFFLHRSMGLAFGNKTIMEDLAEWLGKIDMAIAKTFAAKTGKTPEAMMKLLDGKVDGTVLDADEALAMGFVDEVIPIRREKGKGEDNAENVASESRLANVVPSDPTDGGGEGSPGRWRKPVLGDFGDKPWAELSEKERKGIGEHYGWYANLDTFDSLELAHHFPAKHKNAGKASLNGVCVALKRLLDLQPPDEAWEKIEAHLRAHLPPEDRAKELAELRDESFAGELVDKQLELEQELLEMRTRI